MYIYDENGNVTGIHDQNQTDVVKVYDDASRIYGVTNKNSNNTTLSSYTYTLNDDNLITEIDEIGGDTQTFDYDAMHHLISATRTGTGSYSETYEVDGNGNRTSKTVGDDTYTYDYSDDDEILHEYLGETTTHTWTYDDNGNQLTRTVDATSYTLAYDAENQLTTISTGGSPVKSYTYDGIGRRESRAAGGTTTHFWYDGTELVNERVGSSWTANSVYGLGLLKRSDQYPLYDDQGSSRKVTNDGESVIQSDIYDAFGNIKYTSGSSDISNKFVGALGYRDDGDAGLQQVGARYYDPYVGRFITRDTVLSERPYAYCDGDPVNCVDPSGYDIMTSHGSGGSSGTNFWPPPTVTIPSDQMPRFPGIPPAPPKNPIPYPGWPVFDMPPSFPIDWHPVLGDIPSFPDDGSVARRFEPVLLHKRR